MSIFRLPSTFATAEIFSSNVERGRRVAWGPQAKVLLGEGNVERAWRRPVRKVCGAVVQLQ